MNENYTTYGTLANNDSLQPVYERSGLYPSHWALQTVVSGYGQGAGASIPGGYDMPGLSGGVGGNTGGGSGGPANLDASDQAAADPFNPVTSPVLWAAAFFIIGMLGLRYVHWRG